MLAVLLLQLNSRDFRERLIERDLCFFLHLLFNIRSRNSFPSSTSDSVTKKSTFSRRNFDSLNYPEELHCSNCRWHSAAGWCDLLYRFQNFWKVFIYTPKYVNIGPTFKHTGIPLEGIYINYCTFIVSKTWMYNWNPVYSNTYSLKTWKDFKFNCY